MPSRCWSRPTTCSARARTPRSRPIPTRARHTAMWDSTWPRPATPPNRTRCSATATCGERSSWPRTASGCCATCSATSRRSHRARCRRYGGSGTRRFGSCLTTAARRPGSLRLPLPAASAGRRQYARLVQEQFRIAGVDVQVDEVDFSLYHGRARAGRFDALLNVWNTDPAPSSGFPQTWTPAGFGRSNYGRYDNPEVDRLVDQAVASAANRDQARRAWRAAVETLNRDAPRSEGR